MSGIFARWIQICTMIAVAATCMILLLTLFEIVMRRSGHPTYWVLDSCAYLLCLMVGSAFPAITARNGNVAITLVVDALPQGPRRMTYRGIDLLSGIGCAIAAVLCVIVLQRQIDQGITTVSGVVIPKWWLTAAILHGLLGSCLIHLLHAGAGRPNQKQESAV
ncbi:TRAP transporter small permease [Fertoebacter nigrum]|uniref:TRAP transporter small permease protein n=1 Tax=Fertoeibacter niger TaxID=2656921 RepID=A0A8X8KQ70_9RHOB|nr:TRAP transporter small permease [Fertoeibacter niger]NUB45636.1 TRAP transporter small permease [Fertoeibacter niger]